MTGWNSLLFRDLRVTNVQKAIDTRVVAVVVVVFKGKFPPAPFVAFQGVALRVRPTPYRPQVTVAVINHIAVAMVAAKVEFPA